jgi:hypothetical protein
MKTGNQKPRRLTINLPTEIRNELEIQALAESVTLTELIRRAISAEKFLRGEHKKGNQIFILEKGQEMPTRVVKFS